MTCGYLGSVLLVLHGATVSLIKQYLLIFEE
jgi:hypothetical protein